MHDRVLLTGARAPAPFAASFLTRPDRFPDEPAGSPCGDLAADLLLPAGPYRVRGLDAAQLGRIARRFGGFCVPGDAPGAAHRFLPLGDGDRRVADDVAVEIGGHDRGGAPSRTAPPAGRPAPVRPCDPEPPVALDVLAAPPRSFRRSVTPGWHYSFDLDAGPERVRLAGWGFCALLERRAGGRWRAGLWVAPGDRRGFLGSFVNLLRVLAAYRLLDAGGALLHSAAVADRGAGTLFVGRSGAGKSTVARQALARGLGVLSDELAALTPAPGGAAVSALPFAGDLEPARRPAPPLPLARVLLLAQARRDALVPVSAAQAVAAAAACAPWINADRHRTGALLDNLGRLLGAVPAARLEFTRDGGFWPLLAASGGTISSERSGAAGALTEAEAAA